MSLDFGENTGISTVNYTGTTVSNDVVILTNGYSTILVVNTPGSVKHFSNIGKLVIEEVAMESYHEFGKVRTAEINIGNFVIELKAVVTLVSVKAATVGQVKIAVQAQASLEVVAGDTANYEATISPQTEVTTQEINSLIEDNTLAIIYGLEKESLSPEEFGDREKVILLKDYDTTEITLGSCEVIGNMTKFKAKIKGDKNYFNQKHLHYKY